MDDDKQLTVISDNLASWTVLSELIYSKPDRITHFLFITGSLNYQSWLSYTNRHSPVIKCDALFLSLTWNCSTMSSLSTLIIVTVVLYNFVILSIIFLIDNCSGVSLQPTVSFSIDSLEVCQLLREQFRSYTSRFLTDLFWRRKLCGPDRRHP